MADGAPHPQTASAALLVVQAVAAARAGDPGTPFAMKRAEAELASAPGGVASALRRILDRLGRAEGAGGEGDALASALVRGGAALERAEDVPLAQRLYEAACALRPESPATALHAGRAARRAGDAGSALAHYRRAAAVDPSGPVARLARIGEALLSDARERSLSREIRSAVRSGDAEAAGVGLEQRALVRCETARCGAAIRDLCACALRYPDPDDRARAAERVAGLLLDEGDLEGAREALLLVHEIGDPRQRASAEARLHQVSHAMGDRLGTRRWPPPAALEDRSPAVLPPAAPGPAGRPRRSLPLAVLREWRDAVTPRPGRLPRGEPAHGAPEHAAPELIFRS